MSSSPCPWEGNTSLMTMANGEVMPWYQMCPQVATSAASMVSGSLMSTPTSMSGASGSVMSTMTMAMSSATGTASVSGAMNMGSGSLSTSGQCQMSSMLWNWQTIDACFISSQWHIRTSGDFAGTCISVFVWGMLLQGLLRVQREFDRCLVSRWTRSQTSRGNRFRATSSESTSNDSDSSSQMSGHGDLDMNSKSTPAGTSHTSRRIDAFFSTEISGSPRPLQLKIWQQAIRAWLHAVDFGASYLFMLMAMYYNGYILICMFLGQLFGYFVFSWDTLSRGSQSRQSIACC